MKTIFLESHHIKNLCFGFGQFNYHLLKSLSKIENEDFQFTVHAKDTGFVKKEFGNAFRYKKYYSLRRYPALRITKKYDLWHALNQNTKIEPKTDLPYLLTVHDHPNIKDPQDYREKDDHKIFQQKLDRSAAITYISEYSKLSTHKYYNIPDVPEYVIYNGNPIEYTELPPGFVPRVHTQRPFLFSIGVVQPRKGFNLLVAMMRSLPEFDLIIAGDTTTSAGEELKSLIKSLGLQNRVLLTGKINNSEKQYYYQNCAAFLFPSRREGFGLPVIEAMRFEKPVFLSDKTCLPEIGGDAAYYWNNEDPEYMASIFEQGMDDFERNEDKMKQRLLERSHDFNWDKAAGEYYQVYRNLLL